MSDYNPYTKEQWIGIKQMWDLYKESIGLEGEITLKMVREGKDLEQTNREVEKHRVDMQENLKAWHNLRKES